MVLLNVLGHAGQQDFKTESGDNCRLAMLDEKVDLRASVSVSNLVPWS
jgi:hypothetical protein